MRNQAQRRNQMPEWPKKNWRLIALGLGVALLALTSGGSDKEKEPAPAALTCGSDDAHQTLYTPDLVGGVQQQVAEVYEKVRPTCFGQSLGMLAVAKGYEFTIAYGQDGDGWLAVRANGHPLLPPVAGHPVPDPGQAAAAAKHQHIRP